MSNTMTAVTIFEHGGPEVLKLHQHPLPSPGPGEALIRMKAIGLNHLDLWMRQGIESFKVHFPRILGSDGAGEVAALGEGVTGFAVGQGVMINPAITCGQCEHCLNGQDVYCRRFTMRGEHTDGLGAQWVAMPAANLAPKADFLSWEEAATLPVIFLTAHRMVATLGQPPPGSWVVVQGATSGVGMAAIQVARAEGAQVLAVTRKASAAPRLHELGANEVVADQDTMLARLKELTGKAMASVVVDHVGKATWQGSLRALGVNGRLVTCGATSGHRVEIDLRHLFFKHQQILGSTMGTKEEFRIITRRIGEKLYRPVLDKVFPLTEISQAHKYLESAQQVGKVAVRMDSPSV